MAAVTHVVLSQPTGLYVLALVIGMFAAAARVRESDAAWVLYGCALVAVMAGEVISQ